MGCCAGGRNRLRYVAGNEAEARKPVHRSLRRRATARKRIGIAGDPEGPLFRPLSPDGLHLKRRHLDRKTPWRLVKKYCLAAGIDPNRLKSRGIGVHSLRKTAINDATRYGRPAGTWVYGHYIVGGHYGPRLPPDGTFWKLHHGRSDEGAG